MEGLGKGGWGIKLDEGEEEGAGGGGERGKVNVDGEVECREGGDSWMQLEGRGGEGEGEARASGCDPAAA